MKTESKKLAYSVPEMAGLLGISRTVAYELITKGEIPSVRLGKRKILVPVSRLREWLDKKSAGKDASAPVIDHEGKQFA